MSTEQTRVVAKISVHERYNGATHLNDIAILSISSNFQCDSYVQPISLPSKRQWPGYAGVASGWGFTEDSGTHSNTLKKARVLIYSRSKCQSYYPSYFRGNEMICAGGSYGGGCAGDIGGPLRDTRARRLVGILSFGEGNCSSSVPRVFTKVSNYIEWIEQQAAKGL